METRGRLTGLAMVGASWIMWVFMGLATGGVMMAVTRAIYLLRSELR